MLKVIHVDADSLPSPPDYCRRWFVASAPPDNRILASVVSSCWTLAQPPETESHRALPCRIVMLERKQCAPCHREIYDTFKKLGMGQSWLTPPRPRSLKTTRQTIPSSMPSQVSIYKMLRKIGKFIQQRLSVGSKPAADRCSRRRSHLRSRLREPRTFLSPASS